MISIKDKEFITLTSYIKKHYGIDLTTKKALVEGRLNNLLLDKGFDNYTQYLNYTFSDPTYEEIKKLISKLTTNHTYFYRESNHFEFFKENVLAQLTKESRDKDLRIWSAGCSTGQEPYTLAMIINDYLGDSHYEWDTKILATDISNQALEVAKKGIFSQEDIENLPEDWKRKYFKKIDKDNYEIRSAIKDEIIFRSFNLINEVFPFKKKFNVIFCRNVMIYFDSITRKRVVKKFSEYTQPGGYLFIGHSETITRLDTDYKYIKPSIYRKG